MLTRTLRFMCSESVPRATQLLRRFQLAEQAVKEDGDRLKSLQAEIAEEEKKLQARNKQIHTMRVQLTNDVRKGDQIWTSTKKKTEANKKHSIQNFARGLVELGENLAEIKSLQKEQHDLDMREGFDLTSRLFFNTLEKYNIVKYSPEPGSPFNKETMVVKQQVESEKKEQKGKVAELIENGWEAEGMVIKKAKVSLYK